MYCRFVIGFYMTEIKYLFSFLVNWCIEAPFVPSSIFSVPIYNKIRIQSDQHLFRFFMVLNGCWYCFDMHDFSFHSRRFNLSLLIFDMYWWLHLEKTCACAELPAVLGTQSLPTSPPASSFPSVARAHMCAREKQVRSIITLAPRAHFLGSRRRRGAVRGRG